MDDRLLGGECSRSCIPLAVTRWMACAAAVVFLLAALQGCSGRQSASDRHLARAVELFREGKPPAAKVQVDRAIRAAPSDPAVYESAMAIYISRNRLRDAVRVAEMLLDRHETRRLVPALSKEELAQLHMMLGQSYWELRDIASAECFLRQSLAMAPDSPAVMNALGYLYADENFNLREALRLTQRAVDLAPGNAAIVDSLGWAQYRLGKCDEAVDTLLRAVRLAPDEPELRYHLGAAYAKCGRRAAARVELRKSLLLDSERSDARKLLKSVQN